MDKIVTNYLNVMDEHIRDRIAEQRADNRIRRGSRSVGTHIGVDYNTKRKEVARVLMERMSETNGRFILDEVGSNLLANLLMAGVRRETVKSWLKKYHDFTAPLYTSL